MRFPKLKYPRLCRILTYLVVIGTGLLPIFIVVPLPVPDVVKAIVIIGSLLGLLAYLIPNFMVLMAMDIALATLSCHRTARTQYPLPQRRTEAVIRNSILRYGTECDPLPNRPVPSSLRYSFSSPMTVYSRGIERVIAAYEVDQLNRDLYGSIVRSAKANSRAVSGKKKALFLDSAQKKQALHRVTVILILAHQVEPELRGSLYELVCRQCGDENEDCLVPCVVDLEHRICVFNCLRVPYVGFGYAVKNRGIRIIKNRVFGGSLPLGSEHMLPPIKDVDPEASLWDFWRMVHHEIVGAERKVKRQFEAMSEGEIRIIDDTLYLKWDQRGICQTVRLDHYLKNAAVQRVTNWAYPRSQPIGKKLIQKMEDSIADYFRQQGYRLQFVDAAFFL